MSIVIENLTGLKRRMKVNISAQEFETVYKKHLQRAAENAKIQGFRPGKVPVNLVEQRYGKNIRLEAVGELMDSHFQTAIKEQSLKIAGSPKMNQEPQVLVGQPVEFSIDFEVYPEITLKDMSHIKVERLTTEVSESDIEKMLLELRKQQAEWNEVNRVAANDDQVDIDFAGSIDGNAFEGGASQGFKLLLGSHRMIPGFEEGIVGMKPGDVKDISVAFPKEYHAENLAGKNAVFKITLNKVLEAKLPEINEEFTKKMNIQGGVKALHEDVAKHMRQEAKNVLEARLKQKVLDQLFEANPIEVPEVLVESEIDHLQEAMLKRMGHDHKHDEHCEHPELPRDPYREEARRRVGIGLLLGAVIKMHDIKADPAKVREKVQELAALYPQSEQVVNWYYSNKNMLGHIEASVIEDQAVAKLLEQVQVEEKSVNYQDAVKGGQ